MPEKTQLDRVEGKVNSISDWIEGNGKPGAKLTIDRHDRFLRVIAWGGGITAVAVVAIVIAALGNAIIAHAGG